MQISKKKEYLMPSPAYFHQNKKKMYSSVLHYVYFFSWIVLFCTFTLKNRLYSNTYLEKHISYSDTHAHILTILPYQNFYILAIVPTTTTSVLTTFRLHNHQKHLPDCCSVIFVVVISTYMKHFFTIQIKYCLLKKKNG